MLGDSLRRRQGPHRPPRPPRPPRRGRGLRSWGWARWLLTAVVSVGVCFGVGYLLALFVLFPVPAEAAAGVPTPAVVGHTLHDAQDALEKVGLRLGTLDTLNGEQEPGTVVAQAPLPGQQLRAGAAVSLAISSGPAPVHVPPLRGMMQADAAALLDSLGLASVAFRNISPLPPGQVAQSVPRAGAAMARGDTVRLTVSEGPPLPRAPVTGLDTLPPPEAGGAPSQARGRGGT